MARSLSGMFGDEDVLAASPSTLRTWRGDRMAMVYQDPASALNPSIRVGEQIAEVYRFHKGMRPVYSPDGPRREPALEATG